MGGGGDEKEDDIKRGSRSSARIVATASYLLSRCCSPPAGKSRKPPLPPLLFLLLLSLLLLLLLFSYLNCLLRTKKHMRFIRSKINTTERNHFLLPDALLLLLSTRCGIILRARVLFRRVGYLERYFFSPNARPAPIFYKERIFRVSVFFEKISRL